MRKQIIETLSKNYTKFLTSIDWNDIGYVETTKEIRSTYLTYAYLTMLKSTAASKKYKYATDYISLKAKEQIENRDFKDLRYEHMIPKKLYIQSVLESDAKMGILTVKRVYQLLDKYWYLATITKDEDKMLGKKLKSKMPDNWQQKDIFFRYEVVGLKEHLVKNEWLYSNKL